MSKSKAQKHRKKLVRAGKRDPQENRGIYAFADMRTRKTKTKKDKLYQEKFKGRSSFRNGDYGERLFMFTDILTNRLSVGFSRHFILYACRG